MSYFSRQIVATSRLFLLVGMVLLICTVPAWPQTMSSTGSGGLGSGGGLGQISSSGSSLGGGTGLGSGMALGGSGTSFGGGTTFSGGGGFTGSSSGLGFGTTGGSYTGGAGRTGAAGGGAAGGTGTNYTSPGISANNPFASHYANPMAAGMATGGRATFGTPLYGTITAIGTTTSGLGSRGVGGSGSGLGSGVGGTLAPRFTAAVGFPRRVAVPSTLLAEVQQVVARSTSFEENHDIRVVMDGSTVVLQGKCGCERDRRLAEGMVRLSPGVRDVRNELQVPSGLAKQ